MAGWLQSRAPQRRPPHLTYLFMATFLSCGRAQPDSRSLHPEHIVGSSRGVRVPFGRSAFVDPVEDLVLQVQPGDKCVVNVLDNDPLSQRPGSLTPKKFPCDFGQGEVRYTHLGARSPLKDRVRLQIRYDSPTETLIVPLVLEVEVIFQQLQIVTRTLPLVVEKIHGLSVPIDKKVMGFTYDPAKETCRITPLFGTGGLPRYGHLVNISTSHQQGIDCHTFTSSGYHYLHTAPHNSPNRDYLPMRVDLTSANGVTRQEHFHLTVRIKEGAENTPPRPSFVSMLMMEVSQFVLTALTPEMLAAEDLESDPGDLIFNLTSHLDAETSGYLVSTDDQNLPITSFYQRDLTELRIAFQPPSSESWLERILQLEMQVIDTEGASSETFAFMIVVKPMNTLAPLATRNAGLWLLEGQSRPLSGAGSGMNNLVLSDEDNLEEVKVSVVGGLKHGYLVLAHGTISANSGGNGFNFSPQELHSGLVIYQHDGSDTYSDNLILRLDDGKHQVELLYPITVSPADDEPPVLNANTGLSLAERSMVLISPFMLSATDVDSEDSTILFVLQEPLSHLGELVLRQSEPPAEGEEWKHLLEEELYEKVVSEWYQRDIVDGKLYYRHVGPHNAESVLDQVLLMVLDDNDPPNQSGLQAFTVRIEPVDDIPPELFQGTTLHMTVKEYEVTSFKRKHLRYTDMDTDDRNLKYTIHSHPRDTDPNHPVLTGHIVFTDRPDVQVSSFTQAQTNHHKISYRPPEKELGIVAKVLQFNFTVEDASSNSVQGTFTIFLQPVDNKPPEIINTGFSVQERGSFRFTKTELDATDQDTDTKNIKFSLSQSPIHGQFLYQGESMSLGDSFGLLNIELGHVSYVHNGDESNSDSVSLVVSDGIHEVPVTVRVLIKPVDDEAPTLMLPGGLLGSSLEVLERGETEITTNVIQGTDPDTDDLMLTFIVEDPPNRGEILVNGVPAERFTQQDLLNGDVRYAHHSEEIGLQQQQDFFNLTISDLSDEWVIGGNKVQGVKVHVTILPVDSETPIVKLGDQFSVLEGGKNAITPENLNAEDADTPKDEILCTIIVQPNSGYLENISPAPGSERSRSGIPISAFTIRDIRLGHIYYVQSIHQEVEPVEDRFTFRCSDGIRSSQPLFFSIVIIPTNDEKPEIFTREFIVMEGMSLVIDTPILNAADADQPADELLFIITIPPQHGRVILQQSTSLVSNFTLEDIKESSSIVYEHDDSETKEDSFTILLTDGEHSVEKKILVMVIPVDDETPRMTINDGLEIEIGETMLITNKVLKATDLDSDDKSLTYVVQFGPNQGLLQRLDLDRTLLGNITVGMNFTQDEIDKQLIQYTHTGQEGIRDLIKFDITDGINPFIDRYFYISIGSIDIAFPDVINKGVTLKEGGKVTLTTDLLSTSDINSPDENLRFSITRAPSRGHLESTDQPGIPITTFTQLQLAGNKVYYIHTSEDEMKMDSFEFEVTDGYNPVFRTFRISITDVDNKKPVLSIHDLVAIEGENKLITPFELTAEDMDTPDHLLRFTITQVPVHGSILFNNSRPVASFTKQDLNENLISYRHDGSESTEDSFSFTVTDGTHIEFFVFPDTSFETRKPQMLKVRINSLDNGIPQIIINKGAATLKILPTGHLGFLITSKSLRAEDRDSPNKLLKYRITDGPKHGVIINMAHGNGTARTFTQADIDDVKVCYVLKDGENATSDIIRFSVEDNGGNKLSNQPFRLNWAWISLERNQYTIDEDAKFLEVTLRRRGYLGETSFVSISTKDGAAIADKDFKGKTQKQVQFNPGQTTATWKVKIIVDDEYEESETFQIILSEPVMAALEFPNEAIVEIVDPGDESMVYIRQSEYKIEEDIGELLIPIRRSGDISQELMVVCSTNQGTATGTVPSSVLSYSDYITRPDDHTSIIRFDKDETEKNCRIIIIDDSLYEEDEFFNVTLSMPMGGRVGNEFSTAKVVILADTDDEPAFYFADTDYLVDESSGYVEIRVWRTGTDLSKAATITVRSRKTEPLSADAGTDYVGISRNLDFAPGVNVQSFRVTILDDLGQPVLEGLEKFELVLRMPVNAALGEPSKTTVTINDTISDLPKVQFKEPVYFVNEKDKQVSAIIYRSGDVRQKSSVRCYTRQGSAQVTLDYEERPNTEDSLVVFLPGEIEKPCIVTLMDDTIYEEEEEFRLVLGTPKSDSKFGAAVGDQKETLMKIKDVEDKPIIRFSEVKYSVKEPQEVGKIAVVKIPILRVGDSSKVSIVRVHTKDGSATSGEDYNPLSEDIEFKEGDAEHFVDLEILYDGQREMREAFTVHLKPDDNMVAETQMNKAIVYIEEMDSVADVTFPAVPQVVSLLMYDDTTKSKENPSPPTGYPVVCVTACNPKFSDYDKTGSICVAENINDTLTQYRWLVSAPSGSDGVTSPMREVDSNTFFTDTKSITLDSIYFHAGSRVQCASRAVNANGDPGLELMSPIVTVSRDEGLCQPRVPGTVGAEPFSAKIRYTGPEDTDHPNLIKLTVTMPHMDGMLPVVSTRHMSNFELTLSPDGTRVGNHKCSNLLDYNEVPTKYGFITENTKNDELIGETSPYQYSAALRSSKSLRFYRNLNLEACLWEFNSYYDMSELLTDCSGTIGTDGQVLNLVQSYVTLRVPLYVSYVFHSPAAVGGWQHFDLQSELRLTFVYDTAILWNDGIGSPPESELQGSLYPTSMRINEEGRLVVNFKTEIRFRGQLVMSHPGTSLTSMVMSADHPELTFTLNLLRSEPSFRQPVQQWNFISDFAVRDYSGTYTVKLITCSASPNQEYTVPPICNPREPITFDIDIRFQQVSDPVSTEFSLNTLMFLLSKKELWLSDGSMGFGEGTDVAFSEGSTIYGRVMVDPVQNLGDSFFCSIEKVFLCTGADGYVPKYNPDDKEYGCLADSSTLLYRFKILDKAQPETQEKIFGNVPFDAKLAADSPEALPLVKQPGSDGFSLSSDALFQVAAGREWFIHTIYTVRSRENANRGIGKRSVDYHHMLSSRAIGNDQLLVKRSRRANQDDIALTQDIGAENNRGTNIRHITLRHLKRVSSKDTLPGGGLYDKPALEITGQDTKGTLMPVIGGVAALLLLICTTVIVVVLLKRRELSHSKKETTSNSHCNSRETVTTRHSSSDSSEV
ncbi:FRAS1-related extracellular matrix protein 3 [Ranitomeya imitator]|uniref:FRAS1-related extracellular matrix protein 3 n=1 Tax=Ranitomeya imitator TaxID=111125 RepID=UPI0037E9BDC7